MKNDEEMNIKIQNAALDGERNNGSCRKLAEYLNHEDADRIEAGKKPLPFRNQDGLEVSTEEVIAKIDRNKSHLSGKDDKFFHMVVSPSKEEIDAMGSSERELYKSGQKLIRQILDAYAENFNKNDIEDKSDILACWKPHYERDGDGDHQFHIHVIISRKSKPDSDGKSVKLSSITNHKNTKDGPVKGGFDRKGFCAKCEAIFDRLFGYERKVAESFEYYNAMKHGSPEEKAGQAEALAKERMADSAQSILDGIARRRKNVKDRKEVEEIAEALGQGNTTREANGKDAIVDALDRADLATRIVHIFEVSGSRDALDLNLLAMGTTCAVTLGENGGVEEIIFTHKGRKINAADIMNSKSHDRLLSRWELLTGQKPETKVREILEASKTESLRKEIKKSVSQVNPPAKKPGRGI